MAVRLNDAVEKSFGNEEINDRYERYDKLLGKGAYKYVYWGYDTQKGIDVAWNVVDLDSIPSQSDRDSVNSEISTLEKLKHANILRIYDHWINERTNSLVFITDIVQGGSLKDYIRKRKVTLNVVKEWSRQILTALDFLHSQRPIIIHRDIKCDNIFINNTTSKIIIGDFGLSTNLMSHSFNYSKDFKNKKLSIVGTPEFMAPEMMDENYNEKVDIYAFGLCVLEMITGKYPYDECDNRVRVLHQVAAGIKPQSIKKLKRNVRTFIELCIEKDPNKRPCAKELLNHPFLDTAYTNVKDRLPVSHFVIKKRPGGNNIPPIGTNMHTIPEESSQVNTQKSGIIMDKKKNNNKNKNQHHKNHKNNKNNKNRNDSPHQSVPQQKKKKKERDRDREREMGKTAAVKNNNNKSKRKQNQAKKTDERGEGEQQNGEDGSDDDQGDEIEVLDNAKAWWNENDKITINMAIRTKGKKKNVKFEFDPDEDNITDVTKEMISNLGLAKTTQQKISKVLKQCIKHADSPKCKDEENENNKNNKNTKNNNNGNKTKKKKNSTSQKPNLNKSQRNGGNGNGQNQNVATVVNEVNGQNIQKIQNIQNVQNVQNGQNDNNIETAARDQQDQINTAQLGQQQQKPQQVQQHQQQQQHPQLQSNHSGNSQAQSQGQTQGQGQQQGQIQQQQMHRQQSQQSQHQGIQNGQVTENEMQNMEGSDRYTKPPLVPKSRSHVSVSSQNIQSLQNMQNMQNVQNVQNVQSMNNIPNLSSMASMNNLPNLNVIEGRNDGSSMIVGDGSDANNNSNNNNTREAQSLPQSMHHIRSFSEPGTSMASYANGQMSNQLNNQLSNQLQLNNPLSNPIPTNAMPNQMGGGQLVAQPNQMNMNQIGYSMGTGISPNRVMQAISTNASETVNILGNDGSMQSVAGSASQGSIMSSYTQVQTQVQQQQPPQQHQQQHYSMTMPTSPDMVTDISSQAFYQWLQQTGQKGDDFDSLFSQFRNYRFQINNKHNNNNNQNNMNTNPTNGNNMIPQQVIQNPMIVQNGGPPVNDWFNQQPQQQQSQQQQVMQQAQSQSQLPSQLQSQSGISSMQQQQQVGGINQYQMNAQSASIPGIPAVNPITPLSVIRSVPSIPDSQQNQNDELLSQTSKADVNLSNNANGEDTTNGHNSPNSQNNAKNQNGSNQGTSGLVKSKVSAVLTPVNENTTSDRILPRMAPMTSTTSQSSASSSSGSRTPMNKNKDSLKHRVQQDDQEDPHVWEQRRLMLFKIKMEEEKSKLANPDSASLGKDHDMAEIDKEIKELTQKINHNKSKHGKTQSNGKDKRGSKRKGSATSQAKKSREGGKNSRETSQEHPPQNEDKKIKNENKQKTDKKQEAPIVQKLKSPTLSDENQIGELVQNGDMVNEASDDKPIERDVQSQQVQNNRIKRTKSKPTKQRNNSLPNYRNKVNTTEVASGSQTHSVNLSNGNMAQPTQLQAQQVQQEQQQAQQQARNQGGRGTSTSSNSDENVNVNGNGSVNGNMMYRTNPHTRRDSERNSQSNSVHLAHVETGEELIMNDNTNLNMNGSTTPPSDSESRCSRVSKASKMSNHTLVSMGRSHINNSNISNNNNNKFRNNKRQFSSNSLATLATLEFQYNKMPDVSLLTQDEKDDAMTRIREHESHLKSDYESYYEDQKYILQYTLHQFGGDDEKCNKERDSTRQRLLSKQKQLQRKFKDFLSTQKQLLILKQQWAQSGIERDNSLHRPHVVRLESDSEYTVKKMEIENEFKQKLEYFKEKQTWDFQLYFQQQRQIAKMKVESLRAHMLQKICKTKSSSGSDLSQITQMGQIGRPTRGSIGSVHSLQNTASLNANMNATAAPVTASLTGAVSGPSSVPAQTLQSQALQAPGQLVPPIQIRNGTDFPFPPTPNTVTPGINTPASTTASTLPPNYRSLHNMTGLQNIQYASSVPYIVTPHSQSGQAPLPIGNNNINSMTMINPIHHMRSRRSEDLITPRMIHPAAISGHNQNYTRSQANQPMQSVPQVAQSQQIPQIPAQIAQQQQTQPGQAPPQPTGANQMNAPKRRTPPKDRGNMQPQQQQQQGQGQPQQGAGQAQTNSLFEHSSLPHSNNTSKHQTPQPQTHSSILQQRQQQQQQQMYNGIAMMNPFQNQPNQSNQNQSQVPNQNQNMNQSQNQNQSQKQNQNQTQHSQPHSPIDANIELCRETFKHYVHQQKQQQQQQSNSQTKQQYPQRPKTQQSQRAQQSMQGQYQMYSQYPYSVPMQQGVMGQQGQQLTAQQLAAQQQGQVTNLMIPSRTYRNGPSSPTGSISNQSQNMFRQQQARQAGQAQYQFIQNNVSNGNMRRINSNRNLNLNGKDNESDISNYTMTGNGNFNENNINGTMNGAMNGSINGSIANGGGTLQHTQRLAAFADSLSPPLTLQHTNSQRSNPRANQLQSNQMQAKSSRNLIGNSSMGNLNNINNIASSRNVIGNGTIGNGSIQNGGIGKNNGIGNMGNISSQSEKLIHHSSNRSLNENNGNNNSGNGTSNTSDTINLN